MVSFGFFVKNDLAFRPSLILTWQIMIIVVIYDDEFEACWVETNHPKSPVLLRVVY